MGEYFDAPPSSSSSLPARSTLCCAVPPNAPSLLHVSSSNRAASSVEHFFMRRIRSVSPFFCAMFSKSIMKERTPIKNCTFFFPFATAALSFLTISGRYGSHMSSDFSHIHAIVPCSVRSPPPLPSTPSPASLASGRVGVRSVESVKSTVVVVDVVVGAKLLYGSSSTSMPSMSA